MFTANKLNETKYYIQIGDEQFRASIGKSGVIADKKEGDGGTPLGAFTIREIYYRPDRINPKDIHTDFPLIKLNPNDGWCDDPTAPEYNTPVTLPFKPSHEELWREDHIYDIIAVLSYNIDPVIKGKGSAIFLHIARDNYSGTAGCIALKKEDLLKFLSEFKHEDKIETNLSGNSIVIKPPTPTP